MELKSINSSELRDRLKDVLNDVEHHGAGYLVQRWKAQAAVIIPVEHWHAIHGRAADAGLTRPNGGDAA